MAIPTCSLLVLGPEYSGKTALCNVLQTIWKSVQIPEAIQSQVPFDMKELSEYLRPTRPTTGVENYHCTSSSSEVPALILQEVGGSLTSLWYSYARHCHGILVIIDVTSPTSISQGAEILRSACCAPTFAEAAAASIASAAMPCSPVVPVCCILTHTDADDAIHPHTISRCLQLPALYQAIDDISSFTSIPYSIITGEGLIEIIQWILACA